MSRMRLHARIGSDGWRFRLPSGWQGWRIVRSSRFARAREALGADEVPPPPPGWQRVADVADIVVPSQMRAHTHIRGMRTIRLIRHPHVGEVES